MTLARKKVLNMNENIAVALISIGGVIVGCVLSFFSQLLINKLNNKNVLIQATVGKKIESFESAIKYVLNLCTIAICRENGQDFIDFENENDELYRRVYYTFRLFVTNEQEKKYNDLRNDANQGKIKHSEAYERACEILKFKVLS